MNQPPPIIGAVQVKAETVIETADRMIAEIMRYRARCREETQRIKASEIAGARQETGIFGRLKYPASMSDSEVWRKIYYQDSMISMSIRSYQDQDAEARYGSENTLIEARQLMAMAKNSTDSTVWITSNSILNFLTK